MSEFRIITKKELKTLVQFFRDLTWPLPAGNFKQAVHNGLNWRLDWEHDGGIEYRSGLCFNIDRVDVLVAQSNVTQVALSMTDMVPGVDSAVLKAAQVELNKMLIDIMQVRGKSMYRGERSHWDLPAGGRIILARFDEEIVLTLLSLQYADIERAEAQQGLDPDVPIGDHQESQR